MLKDGIGTISGISPNVQLLLNQFYALNFPNNNTAQILRNYIKNDATALHIINNYSNGYKYLVQLKEPYNIGFRFIYKNLFTGGAEDYTISEAGRVTYVYQNPNSHTILAISPIQQIGGGGNGGGGNGGGGNGGGGNGGGYTGGTPLKFNPDGTVKKENTEILAGFDTKNILFIGLAAASIYFIMK